MTFSGCNYTTIREKKKAVDTAVPEFVLMFISIFSKVMRSTKLQGAEHSPELTLRSMDFSAPENLIFSSSVFT